MVKAATHSLCKSANAIGEGLATEEKLIASVEEVARSTDHLFVTCKVKAYSDSVVMRRLQVGVVVSYILISD